MMLRNQEFLDQIVRHLERFEVQTASDPSLRPAAVAVVIADAGHGAELSGFPSHPSWSSEAALLLTRRAKSLRRHAGQWALPGGRIDTGESPEQAALRELAEEVDLHLDSAAVLGRLDDIPTMSGYRMTPVVLWAGAAKQLQPNPAEVASVHRIPVAELMRADSPILDPGIDGGEPVLRVPVGDSWIAAPTASVLLQFRDVAVRGLDTRVAHYGQPRFTWS